MDQNTKQELTYISRNEGFQFDKNCTQQKVK